MERWEPITESAFLELLDKQYGELNGDERIVFDRHRVLPWRATIRRSEDSGDEHVFVIARLEEAVLYFDDVEYGFNFSAVDAAGRVLTPGGSQASLKEIMVRWSRS
jgi:hypothetical protein